MILCKKGNEIFLLKMYNCYFLLRSNKQIYFFFVEDYTVFLLVCLVVGHVCPYSIWRLAIFVPTVLVMPHFWTMASIKFSFDVIVKDIFPEVKSLKHW